MSHSQQIKKIAVIGNVAGGKTRLSRKISAKHNIPLTHIDSIQFLPGMIIRPMPETREIINKITSQETWLIDGFGPLDILEKRFALADRIIFIDLPLWRHLWWCCKRQLKNIYSRRAELPDGCNELTYNHTKKLFKTIWQIHKKMRPELIRILNRDKNKPKLIWIKSVGELKGVLDNGTL